MRTIAILALLGFIYNPLLAIENAEAEVNIKPIERNLDAELLLTIQGNSLVKAANPDTYGMIGFKDVGSRYLIVTAYSSTPDQTDDSPFITASGSMVRDGIVACNTLRFGTKVKFPQIYSDKIFVVEDRMAPKNSHKADIWFPSREEAKQFGVKYTEMVILGF